MSGDLTCTCGHAIEEHGHDDAFPGSTACTECAECIAYEGDPAKDAEYIANVRRLNADRQRDVRDKASARPGRKR